MDAHEQPERKQAETYRDISREVLQILNEPGNLQDSIQRVLAALKRRTGVDAMGIRLQDGDDFPYFVHDGFSKDFLQTENTLIARGADGGVCRHKDGNVSLACTCGLVVSGKTDPANPLFTRGGSCWTNDSFPLLELPPDQDPRHKPRNRCIHHGYASMALVPVRMKNRIVGLVQLNDRRKGCFSLATIEHLEGIAAHVGEALMRKQAEEALRESEENFRHSLDDSPLGVRIATAEGETIYANRAILDIYGFSSLEELRTTPIEKRYTAESYIEFKKRHERRQRGEKSPSEYEVSIVRKNGEVRHLLVSRKELLWNGKKQYQTLYQDITERIRAEESHARLATAVEQSAEAIMITDANATILYVNPAFEKTTGHTREKAIGQKPRILKSGKHDAEFYRQMWTQLSRGEVWIGHMINKRKDGTLYEEEASISPVRDAAGNIVNYVAVKRDITAELNVQAQLNHAQKMEAVGLLAGGMAHDFNNILQIILGNVELALSRTEPDNPLRAELEEVRSAGRRGADLICKLLGFARKQTIAPRTMDLNEAVKGILKMLRRLIGENIEIVWIPRAGLWPIRMDPVQIDQILVNLCVNARDGIDGVGTVHIATENASVDELHAARHDGVSPGDYVLLTVSDTGCGMDKETQGKIFEPFFTTKEVGKGTGLGLATVYGILQQNQGHIAVYSEPGMGTTFHIYLPRHMGNDAVPITEGPAKPLSRGSGTLLLVEDDSCLLEMCGRMLRRLGYNVLTAGTSEVALRLAEEHADEIQLLVSDVVMPGMKGSELAGRLKARYPNLKCLFMSGFTMGIITHQGKREGIGHFIQKPFSLADLAAKVREVLVET